MKKLYFLVCLIGFQTLCQTDSDFEAKRNHVEKLANSNPEVAFTEADAILKQAKASRSAAKIAKAESTMALVKIYLTDLEDAKKRNEKSLSYHLNTNDAAELANNYFNSALLCERESDYVGSVKYFLKTIANAEKSKDYVLIQKSYRGLAMSYLDQRDYNKALEFANQSLAYQKFEQNTTQRAYSLAAIGEVYRVKENLPKANQFFKQAYDSFAAEKNEHGMAWVLTNWAICDEHDLIRFMEKSLDAQQIWDRVAPENTMSMMNLGNIGYNYMVMSLHDSIIRDIKSPRIPKTKAGLIQASENYFKRSLEIAARKKNGNVMIHQHNNLAALQYFAGKYKDAYDNLKISATLGDSIYSQQNKNKIAALESEKEILMRDEKIRLDKLTLANKEKQKWYFISGLLLLGIIGLLLFYQNRNRRKTNEKLQSLNADLDQKNASLDQANKTNARFFSILNHDLRSPVYNLIHYLHLQKDSPELLDPDIKKNIEAKNITSAENLLQSMEDLLMWSKSQMENFKPQPHEVVLESIFEDTQKHFSSEERITIKFENPENIRLFTDENYLKTILRNLTGNAIKALQKTEQPMIVWKAWKENGLIYLSVTDNGSGGTGDQFRALYDDTEVVGIQTGLGLHLIRDLAKAIDCEIAVDTKPNHGTTFTLLLR